MRILVIDDDAYIRSGLRRLLVRKYGAEVAEASDGVVGLQCLLDVTYDLVLLDLHMRTMDGMETLRAIRRSPKLGSMPIMMLTGDSDESIVANALALGVQDFLIKPVDATILFERIDAALVRAGKDAPVEAAADVPVAAAAIAPAAVTIPIVPAAAPRLKAPIRRVLAECVKLRY
jgi:two-component system chemotaxis response regulator CheY